MLEHVAPENVARGRPVSSMETVLRYGLRTARKRMKRKSDKEVYR